MKTLIEVGAFDGSDSLRYHNEGYVVYTFEPKKDLFEDLVNKTKHLTNYTVIPKAVSLVDGTTQFNICKSGGASSILPFRSEEELIKTWSIYRTDIHYSGISYEVETIRLDTFIESNNLNNTIIDFIHIDAQGAEYKILSNMGDLRPDCIFAETCEYSIYDGAGSLDLLDNLMFSMGYKIEQRLPYDTFYVLKK